jgi:hypothetical protein
MATDKNINKALVFPKAGQFMAQKYKADGTLDPNAVYVSANNVVKTVNRATTPQTSDLPDGNSNYPAHTYVTSEESIITVGFSTYDPDLEAFVKDAGYTENSTTADTFRVIEQIAAATSVVLKNPVKDASFFIQIKDKFGNVLTVAEAEPTAGQYKVAVAEDPASSGVQKATLTFAAADAERELFITYDSYQTGITQIDYSERSTLPAFQLTIIGETMAYDETQTVMTNIVIDKANLNGGITPPNQSNDPTQGWEIAFKTGKPRSGKKPVSIKFLPI